MLKNKNRYFWLLLALLTLAPVVNIYAEGSRTLYPDGATGYRAYLRSTTNVQDYYPFPNLGTHYVYAKPGETIALASSAQRNNTDQKIRLYAPNNPTTPVTLISYEGNGSSRVYYGNIPNRASEIAGPLVPGETATGANADKYRPIYYTIPTTGPNAQEGIYKVEFLPTGSNTGNTTTISGPSEANGDWQQHTSTNLISAWDVSVINASNGFEKGRVYTNVLNMRVPLSTNHGFEGVVYVLTKDGYVYEVDNNGNNGYAFTFFVNNNGFVDRTNQTPLYKSLNYSNATNLNNRVHNPNSADAGTHITHKLFYTNPLDQQSTLPLHDAGTTIPGAVPGGSTWLKTTPIIPGVTQPTIIGMDGRPGQVSNKGGKINFTADVQGNYTIEIISQLPAGDPSHFPTRVMTGQAIQGSNMVIWDGKDGANQPLPGGDHPIKVTVQLQGAEVHFPFIDMELNIYGTIIQLLNGPADTDPYKVYWDDSDISIVTTGASQGSGGQNNGGSRPSPINNSHLTDRYVDNISHGDGNGVSSETNGHKWGSGIGNADYGFGNGRSIDTWTFITGEKKEAQTNVTVKIADLEVVSVKTREPETTTDKHDFAIDEVVEYEVVLKNNGPDDVIGSRFTFRLPPGFDPVDDFTPTFTSSCGTQDVVVQYDPVVHAYWSELSLLKECEGTYIFRTTITENSDPDNLDAVAGILRPDDVTDPNAINRSDPEKPVYTLDPGRTWDDLWKYPVEWPDDDDVDNYYIPPFSAEFECANRDPFVTEECNNVKNKPVGLTRVSDLEMKKTVKNRPAIISVGDDIEFELTVKNNGPHAGAGIEVTDEVPDGFTILPATISNDGAIVSGTNTIKWTFNPDYRLAKGDSLTLTFKVKVKSSGSYLNIATVTGDGEDPNPDNNTDTESASPKNNYWLGGKVDAPNDWKEEENWTGGYVPQPGEDIEFATELNNPTDAGNPKSGPAKENLHLGNGDGTTSRIIGGLINDSDKDLWITTGDQLTIKGEVKDGNPAAGTIVVKSSPTAPTGTLIFEDPTKNGSVGATVEFYNQAYDCADCGFYTRSWQYFGVPVDGSDFPFQSPVSELVNRWEEPVNGNKWVSVTSGNLIPFRGYQITNTNKTEPPTHIYDFAGTLNVGDKNVALTRTTTPVVVNYAGANLVANSYTAAIPIKPAAMTFTNAAATVYLFNTGTRDQWRKLNGTAINQQGYRAGQYLAVPVNLGGTLHFPDRIPSMHSFMVLVDEAETTGNVALKYDQLTKNTKVALGDGSTKIVTRSADSKGASSIPSLVMDVIGEESADRVWIFAKEGTTYGFDNGWDGHKMTESGIAQLYVADDAGKDHFQVATVPGFDNVSLGFVADADGKYTIEFALSDHWTTGEVWLHDLATGVQTRIVNGDSYTFEAKKGDAGLRFRLSTSGSNIPVDEEAAKIVVNATDAGAIVISNNSSNDCSVSISNTAGRILQKLEVKARDEAVTENLSRGTYIVRLQNAVINDARKIIVR